MTEYTEIFGDKQLSAAQQNTRAILELIDDPRGRKKVSNFIYNVDPRVKSADFSSYPIVYIESYGLTNNSVNVGGNIFNKTLELEIHILVEDDGAQQKQWYDTVSDDLTYKFEYGQRYELGQQGISQPMIIRDQSFPGIERADQPILRREIEIEAGVQIDMEQVGGNNPYA